MATSGFFSHRYFDSGYFTPVWFAPADDSHLTPEEITGGIGHGGKSKQAKKKAVFLERDGKVLVFANATRAASYIAAEKQAEVVQDAEKPASAVAPQAPIKAEVKAIHQPVEIIAYDAIAALVQSFALVSDLSALIQAHELDAVMALYQQARDLQDEEDIELLLLAA